ncbi:hypothetical protein [Mycolicibacterium sp.]|uniref:hypothetical protein n=1 Tax=Mycolicibacterium sp. TaxID=2320850 RepID=UPI001A2BB010|nr:hypothetical protein [Mycolicibacterium sp.]MBJ7337821.1 hypothetical protein [Mycolicibacterium sp.]
MTATIATRPLSDSSDSLLRFAMRLDATVTGFLGLGIAAAADPFAALTGLTPAQEYAVGGAFVLYGVVVYSLAAMRNVRRTGLGLAAFNAAGTIAAAAVAATDVLPLTGFGMAVVLACGVYTAAFAVLQYLGVRRLA